MPSVGVILGSSVGAVVGAEVGVEVGIKVGVAVGASEQRIWMQSLQRLRFLARKALQQTSAAAEHAVHVSAAQL